MSFLKYQEDQEITTGNDRGPVHFARAHIDGMPYRGQAVPLRDEEFDEFTEIVWDGKVKMFDTSNAEDLAELQVVVDRIANGWYRGMKETEKWVEKNGETILMIFMAWAEPHRELNRGKAGHLLASSPIPTNNQVRMT